MDPVNSSAYTNQLSLEKKLDESEPVNENYPQGPMSRIKSIQAFERPSLHASG